jgi:hypothetical protein
MSASVFSERPMEFWFNLMYFQRDVRYAERRILSDKDERPASPFPSAMPEQARLGKIVSADFSWNGLYRKICRKILAPDPDMAISSAAFAIEKGDPGGDRGPLPALLQALERQCELPESTILEVLA